MNSEPTLTATEVARRRERLRAENEALRTRRRSKPMKDDPAFPITAHQNVSATGLTKREYFADMALQGIVEGGEAPLEWAAGTAVKFADALIAELEKGR